MILRRNWLVYGLLLAVWLVIVGWQAIEHRRVIQAARNSLVSQAHYIASTFEKIVRSQARFGPFSFLDEVRLESALDEMVKMGEMKSIFLLNASGAVVVGAGEEISPDTTNHLRFASQKWGERTVALLSPIDLGTNVVREGESGGLIVVSTNDWRGPPRNRRRSDRDGDGTNRQSIATNQLSETARREGGPSSSERRTDEDRQGGERQDGDRREGDRERDGRDGDRRDGDRPRRPTPEQFREILEKRGLHSFLMVMSTDSIRQARGHDFWLRFMIAAFGGIASAGLALAWRNVEKTSDLQFRLLRASEMNNHLKEMNIAAAGLAHETRNPLNIIRGLAQIISNQPDATSEVRQKSRAITDEVDRITAQLNEFMSYSKPREVRRSPVALGSAIGEVGRALQFDLEDKAIQFSVVDFGLVIEADEQLLRQLLFNLLLNAIQAVEPKGEIRIVTSRITANEASIEVRDNGPGVPESQRGEIFKPYFTTHQKGTGLGLAVVQQIVLAHGWEIHCLSNEPRGAIFRLTHLKLCPTA